MRFPQIRALCAALLVTLIGCASHKETTLFTPQPTWRAGWVSLGKSEPALASAKQCGFNVLIVTGEGERLEAFAQEAARHGIETYGVYAAVARKGLEKFAQMMTPEEEEIHARIAADKDPRRHGYQVGGEPLPGRREVLLSRLLCFHRPEVRELVRDTIRRKLLEAPSLTGIAFDFFGYQNYHSCECPVSRAQFAQWRTTHGDMPDDEAKNAFSLETLVAFNNEMADFARSIHSGIKVAAHVYPLFQPEPLYGNRLNIDYCGQTVAWFFEPYWSDEKIRHYARTVVQEGGRYHPTARGIPFVALYVNMRIADKPVEQFRRELDAVFSVTGDTSVLLHDSAVLGQRPEYGEAFLAAVREAESLHGAIAREDAKSRAAGR